MKSLLILIILSVSKKIMFTKYIIRFYQTFLSPDKSIFSSGRTTCAMHPTCSEYAEIAIKKYGLIIGIKKSFFRILRCHPWQKNLIDEP